MTVIVFFEIELHFTKLNFNVCHFNIRRWFVNQTLSDMKLDKNEEHCKTLSKHVSLIGNTK